MNTQGQQQQTSTQGQPVLYGIPLSGIDFETQKLIQKVMRAATAIFVTVILVAIINLLNGESFIVVAGMIFISGAVVSCGYYGARDRNVSLLNMFTFCNACAGVCHILWLIQTYLFYTIVKHCRKCLDGDTSETRNVINGTASSCRRYEDVSDCDVTGLAIVDTIVYLIIAGFYFYTCRLSSKLASRPVFVQHISGNPVSTISTHQQHGTVIQARVINVEGGGYPQQQGQAVVFQSNPQMVMAHQPRVLGANAVIQESNQGKSTQAL